MHQEGFYCSSGRRNLYYQAWIPNRPVAVLVGVHGLGNHSGYYRELGLYLEKEKIALYAMDLQGFGHNQGERGHIDRFTHYYTDVAEFTRQVCLPEGLPCYLCGESLGGLVALHTAARDQQNYDGLILLSPAIWNKVNLPLFLLAKARLAAIFNPLLRFSLGAAFSGQDTSRDPERQKEVAADPLVVKQISARFYAQMRKAMRTALQQAPAIRIPALILQAKEDNLLDIRGAERFNALLGSEDKEFGLLEGYYHALLTDLGREAVFARIAAWIHARLH